MQIIFAVGQCHDYYLLETLEWLAADESTTLEENMKFLMSIGSESESGYTYEVDLHVPANLHDYFEDLPTAGEKASIPDGKLSPYQTDLFQKQNTYVAKGNGTKAGES